MEPTGRTLLSAVARGDREQARLLVEAGVYTGQRDDRGRTPLQIAIERKDLPLSWFLADAGCDPDAVATDGTSALSSALASGENALVDRLMDAGAPADARMPDGERVLPWAIREGRLSFVRRAMLAGADPHQKDEAGNSLIHVAMQAGRKDLVETLLECGADAGTVDASGRTPLHHAFERGWPDLVPKLVQAGADPGLPDDKGRMPIEEAIRFKDVAMLELFLKTGASADRRNTAGETAVHLVLRSDWPEGRRVLARHRADFNAADPQGRTPLMLAMATGNLELAQELVADGAKAGKRAWNDWLWKSVNTGDTVLLRKLLRAGADPSATGPRGILPMEAAVSRRDAPLIWMLLEANAAPGRSMLMACSRGDLETASLLVAGGLSYNATPAPWLDTPLAAAIRADSPPLVEFLLTRGANPHLRAKEGQGPLGLAIALRRPEMVSRLLAAGVDANEPLAVPARPEFLKLISSATMRYVLKMDRNVTPLMLAASSGEPASAVALLTAGANTETRTRGVNFWPINFASNQGDVKMMRVLLGKDPAREERQIIISLSEQRARVLNDLGEEIFATSVSTGRKGFGTPTGEFVITNKHRDWKSTLYHAQMPFFLRLSCGDFGLHQGVVPGYPASHGCIRVPAGNAQKLFTLTKLGDRVRIIP